ncbi:endonuclease/exonuclease/phosphatase family protein [Nocardioides sp. SYSU DS0651]|uniref:endonuclease/exonuclease/phosphatase family protein n=1 Tax=Nocardioides sp. SYSU DS0651 TaxID=3415955 RepID=UPI003F4BE930
MRIGTWNLQGRWDDRHRRLVDQMECDIWLLTEVSDRVRLSGRHLHVTELEMTPKRRWAGIATHLPLTALPDPHGASAMAEVDGLRVCASILPWRSCGTREPWTGSTTAQKTTAATSAIEAATPTIWGGDWNHAVSGREWSGSIAGRHSILATVERLRLQVPTANAPHQIDGLLSIDHVAVPASWPVSSVERHRAFVDDARISDHDAYVVVVVPVRPSDRR